MKEDTTYNGWTNYATWRINLEWFDGNDELLQELSQNAGNVGHFAHNLQAYIVTALDSEFNDVSSNNTFLHYAAAFIADVNWYEIAQHYTELLFDIDEVQK
jgi:hypothetical protein